MAELEEGLAAGRQARRPTFDGAVRLSADGPSQVAAGHTLRVQGGAVIDSSPPTLIASAPGGPVSRLISFALGDLAPGAYELTLDIEDRVAGRTLSKREELVLESP